jgi:arginase family enzyme
MPLILKIPFSGGGLGKTKGCEKAPDLIVESMMQWELDENGNYVDIKNNHIKNNFDIHSIEADNNNISYTNEQILQCDLKPRLILGGDHSITYSCFKRFASPKSGLIVFDAHPDTENNFSPPSHEDYLRVLIEEGIISSRQVILVGLRSISKNEIEYLRNKKILYFDMNKIHDLGIHELCEILMENLMRFENYYISLDIDVLDPSFAPGTGYCEPGGLSTRDMLYVLSRFKKMKKLKCADLVEVNPDKDINGMTINAAAKLAIELVNSSN